MQYPAVGSDRRALRPIGGAAAQLLDRLKRQLARIQKLPAVLPKGARDNYLALVL